MLQCRQFRWLRFRRMRAEHRGGFHPTGFVRLLRAESDGGEHIVQQDAGFAVEQFAVQRIFGRRADADHHQVRGFDCGGQAREVV